MDTTQLLLTIVLTVSTILLIIVGIQLVFVLMELRTALIKVNRIIAGFEKVGESIEHGFGELTGFVASFKTILKFIDIFQKKKHDKSKT
jgi:hypothetical protein